MVHKPTLSVLIPNYNHAHFLPEALDSILSQSYKPTEIIILDDGSTDNSLEILKEYKKREPSILVENNSTNLGVVPTVNRLFEMANCDYVFCPSADDVLLPGFFEESMTLLGKHPEAGLCSAVGTLMTEEGKHIGIRAIPIISSKPCYLSPKKVRSKMNLLGRWIDSGTVIYRRSALETEGGQVDELGSFADTFLNMLIALRHGVCYVPKPSMRWRQVEGGYAASNIENWQGLQSRGILAAELMRTKHRDLFEPNQVRMFERQWAYLVNVSASQFVRLQQKRELDRIASQFFPHNTLLDRAFWSVTQSLFALVHLLWRLYLMARLGPWRWWILGRLSIMVNLKTIVLFK